MWRRKRLRQFIGTKATLERIQPMEETEAHRWVVRLLKEPDNFANHIRLSVRIIFNTRA